MCSRYKHNALDMGKAWVLGMDMDPAVVYSRTDAPPRPH